MDLHLGMPRLEVGVVLRPIWRLMIMDLRSSSPSTVQCSTSTAAGEQVPKRAKLLWSR